MLRYFDGRDDNDMDYPNGTVMDNTRLGVKKDSSSATSLLGSEEQIGEEMLLSTDFSTSYSYRLPPTAALVNGYYYEPSDQSSEGSESDSDLSSIDIMEARGSSAQQEEERDATEEGWEIVCDEDFDTAQHCHKEINNTATRKTAVPSNRNLPLFTLLPSPNGDGIFMVVGRGSGEQVQFTKEEAFHFQSYFDMADMEGKGRLTSEEGLHFLRPCGLPERELRGWWAEAAAARASPLGLPRPPPPPGAARGGRGGEAAAYLGPRRRRRPGGGGGGGGGGAGAGRLGRAGWFLVLKAVGRRQRRLAAGGGAGEGPAPPGLRDLLLPAAAAAGGGEGEGGEGPAPLLPQLQLFNCVREFDFETFSLSVTFESTRTRKIHTEYLLRTETNFPTFRNQDVQVWRRFRDFVWLDAALSAAGCGRALPPFPFPPPAAAAAARRPQEGEAASPAPADDEPGGGGGGGRGGVAAAAAAALAAPGRRLWHRVATFATRRRPEVVADRAAALGRWLRALGRHPAARAAWPVRAFLGLQRRAAWRAARRLLPAADPGRKRAFLSTLAAYSKDQKDGALLGCCVHLPKTVPFQNIPENIVASYTPEQTFAAGAEAALRPAGELAARALGPLRKIEKALAARRAHRRAQATLLDDLGASLARSLDFGRSEEGSSSSTDSDRAAKLRRQRVEILFGRTGNMLESLAGARGPEGLARGAAGAAGPLGATARGLTQRGALRRAAREAALEAQDCRRRATSFPGPGGGPQRAQRAALERQRAAQECAENIRLNIVADFQWLLKSTERSLKTFTNSFVKVQIEHSTEMKKCWEEMAAELGFTDDDVLESRNRVSKKVDSLFEESISCSGGAILGLSSSAYSCSVLENSNKQHAATGGIKTAAAYTFVTPSAPPHPTGTGQNKGHGTSPGFNEANATTTINRSTIPASKFAAFVADDHRCHQDNHEQQLQQRHKQLPLSLLQVAGEPSNQDSDDDTSSYHHHRKKKPEVRKGRRIIVRDDSNDDEGDSDDGEGGDGWRLNTPPAVPAGSSVEYVFEAVAR